MANCTCLFPSSPASCSGRTCFGSSTPSSAGATAGNHSTTPGQQQRELYCDYPQSLKLKMASKRRNTFYENKKQETTEIESGGRRRDGREMSTSGSAPKRKPRKITPENIPRPGGYVPVARVKPLNSTKIYHKVNDLSTASLGWAPRNAVSSKPVAKCNRLVDAKMSKARLLNEYSYTTWATSTMPLSDVNRNLHLDSTLGLVVKLANNDTDGLTHGDYYQGVQFLKTITDDKGQYPPNILALLEYIDYTTKEDGTDPVTPEETE